MPRADDVLRHDKRGYERTIGGRADGVIADQEFPHVLSPLNIGNVTVPNRTVRSAHGASLTQSGQISDELMAYHAVRAAGGVALTILEIATAPRSGGAGGIRIWDDEVLKGYERIRAALANYPMKLFHQLHHGGRTTAPADGAAALVGFGHARPADPDHAEQPLDRGKRWKTISR